MYILKYDNQSLVFENKEKLIKFVMDEYRKVVRGIKICWIEQNRFKEPFIKFLYDPESTPPIYFLNHMNCCENISSYSVAVPELEKSNFFCSWVQKKKINYDFCSQQYTVWKKLFKLEEEIEDVSSIKRLKWLYKGKAKNIMSFWWNKHQYIWYDPVADKIKSIQHIPDTNKV